MSALYFGLGHINGMPSGCIGIAMASFLGWIACRAVLDTRGLAWAVTIHLVQDVGIFWFLAALVGSNH